MLMLNRFRAVPFTVFVAGTALVLIALYAVVVPLTANADSLLSDYAMAGLPPGEGGLMGTDSAGHGLFVRVAQGLRISLLIALITSVCSCIIGALLGILAGMTGGWVDRFIMRIVDAMNALPHLLVGVLIVSLFRGSVTAIIASLVLTHWIPIARIVRAQIIGLRHAEFIEAAWLSGMNRWQVIWRHLAPAALGQTMVGLVLLIPHTIWHESTLSFLGLGLPPHQASLGTLLSDAQGALLLGQWWILAFPGLFLVAATLSVSVVGGYLKDRIVGRRETLR